MYLRLIRNSYRISRCCFEVGYFREKLESEIGTSVGEGEQVREHGGYCFRMARYPIYSQIALAWKGVLVTKFHTKSSYFCVRTCVRKIV